MKWLLNSFVRIFGELTSFPSIQILVGSFCSSFRSSFISSFNIFCFLFELSFLFSSSALSFYIFLFATFCMCFSVSRVLVATVIKLSASSLTSAVSLEILSLLFLLSCTPWKGARVCIIVSNSSVKVLAISSMSCLLEDFLKS